MKRFFVVLCVVGLFPLWIKAEEKKTEITISYIEGEVETLLAGKKDWEKAKLYGKLKEGDRIRTKLQSKAELKLANGSTINIAENSIMDIKELFQKDKTEKSSFKLWMGGVKARFERLKTKDSEAKFYTPTAVMGLRGTTIWLLVDFEGRTRASFEEGHGYIYSDKEGEKPVGEGQEAEVSLEGDITIKTLEMKTVPNVVGKSLSDARNDIIGASLRPGQIRAEESDQTPDTVLSQYPVAGSEVLANTSVSLVVASEIPPSVVPDVIGLSIEAAEARIEEAGLTLGMIIEEVSTRPKDEVLRQRPIPGTEVKKGSPVDIAISKGPLPRVIVPNLIGKTPEEAKAILEGVGLRLSGIVLKKESKIIEEGRIVEQNPEAGASVDLNSFVQVTIAQPLVVEKPPIPNINSRWTIPGLFVNEIPDLVLMITPNEWAPLFLQVMGRLTRFNNPPYVLNFTPPIMRTGANTINVSCWFENGPKANEIISSPYYDPIPPKIISVRVRGEVINVVVEDRESGINYVRIEGEIVTTPKEYIQEERVGRNVYVRGTYERKIPIVTNKSTIPINIEVEDNAGNKRTRIERIPDVPPSPRK